MIVGSDVEAAAENSITLSKAPSNQHETANETTLDSSGLSTTLNIAVSQSGERQFLPVVFTANKIHRARLILFFHRHVPITLSL